MKIKVGAYYIYNPNGWDIIDAKTRLHAGDIVRVENAAGCPKAGTMNCCHVWAIKSRAYGNYQFAGLVSCDSLQTPQEWERYCREQSIEDEVVGFETWKGGAM